MESGICFTDEEKKGPFEGNIDSCASLGRAILCVFLSLYRI